MTGSPRPSPPRWTPEASVVLVMYYGHSNPEAASRATRTGEAFRERSLICDMGLPTELPYRILIEKEGSGHSSLLGVICTRWAEADPGACLSQPGSELLEAPSCFLPRPCPHLLLLFASVCTYIYTYADGIVRLLSGKALLSFAASPGRVGSNQHTFF